MGLLSEGFIWPFESQRINKIASRCAGWNKWQKQPPPKGRIRLQSYPTLRRGAEKEEKEQHDTGELCTSVLLLLLKTNIGVLFASFYSIVPSAQVFFNIAYDAH